MVTVCARYLESCNESIVFKTSFHELMCQLHKMSGSLFNMCNSMS